jgi:hypothetical protein
MLARRPLTATFGGQEAVMGLALGILTLYRHESRLTPIP